MRGRLAVLLAGFLSIPPCLAQVVSERPDSAVVTIYHQGVVDTAELTGGGAEELRNSGLAFITETRTVDLPAGPATIELRGVASTMVPQTAEIQGLPAEILERNFDYDLLSPAALLDKSVGGTVRLVRTDPKTGKTTEQLAVVRSGAQGTVLELNGRFEALHCSGLPEKLVLDRIPEGLRDTPTLSIHTRAAQAGRYTIKLSYIATAMNWSADYVARLGPDGRTLDLNGWITLTNFGDTGFAHVPVEVVAGRLETTGEDVPVDPLRRYPSDGCWPMNVDWSSMIDRFKSLPPPAPPPPAAQDVGMLETVTLTGARAPTIEATQLGDYKLYALPNATDLKARQTKQVQFLAQEGVPFDRIYTYDVGCDESEVDQPVTARLRLDNTETGRLGKPLPAGSVSVIDEAGSTPVFLGRDRIQDIAVGLPIEITLGKAMGVSLQCRLASMKSAGSGRRKATRVSYEIAVRNDKPAPIAFELRQPRLEGVRIVSESQRHAVKPAGFVWAFALKPNETKVLTFTADVAR